MLPNTGLFTRLEKEGRLLEDLGGISQTDVLNFVPTRPTAEIAREYLAALQRLNDPVNYMGRVYRMSLELGLDRPAAPPQDLGIDPNSIPKRGISLHDVIREIRTYGAAFMLVYRQGIKRASRRVFWKHVWALLRQNRDRLGIFLASCAHNEQFLDLTEHTLKTIAPPAG